MRLEQLVELWGTPLGADGLDLSQPVGRVCADSRQLRPGDLFVPLVGERFDGHRFLEQALATGARVALIQRDRIEARPPGLPCWVVDDTLAAYQELARQWRRTLRLPVVAVTGSAGKTTTRELIRAALAPLGPVLASVGNENNDIGVPLTLLKATDRHAAMVVEMGMRGLGEIERLSLCAEPDVAVITNIGTAHIGRLGSREAIGQAKCEITAALRPDGLVVIPAGDPLLEEVLARVWSGRVVRVALADDPIGVSRNGLLPAPDRVGRLEAGGAQAGAAEWLRLAGGTGPERIRLPLAGRHNARNLLLALAVAEELGVKPETLTALEVEVPGGRSRRQWVQGVEVLDETYNASPEAMLAALDLLASGAGRRFAALGTMLELGDQSLELHRLVAARAAGLGLDGLVIVAGGAEGEAMLRAASGLARCVRVRAPEDAVAPLLEWLGPGDRLLLKASRGVALERLIPLLAQGLTAGFNPSPETSSPG